MSWGSVELENYDTAYCTTCQRPVSRLSDDKSWRHNGYHKDNGSHTIEPYDIALSNETQRIILEEENMADDTTTAVSPEPEYNNLTGDFGPQPATYKTGSNSPVQPVPQPECTNCHGFGAGVVQGAVERLKKDVLLNGTKAPRMKDIDTLIKALESHHG